uniref:Uncharacterized protein n=1 Tax=Bionectria ochroleuca TaxID=29856 RepID=A0A8H7N1M3_BIOOC
MQSHAPSPSANTLPPGASLLKKRVARDPIYDLFWEQRGMQRNQAAASSASGATMPPSRPLEMVTREKPKPAGIAGASPNLSRDIHRRQTAVVPPVHPLPPQPNH